MVLALPRIEGARGLRTIRSRTARAFALSSTPDPETPRLGLGLDAGGTATRWALADAAGRLIAEGTLAPISGHQWMQGEAGQAAVRGVLAAAARAAHEAGAATLHGACAGITGLAEDQRAELGAALAAAADVAPGTATACNDIELACRAAFAPGAGIVVYAGTGSVAASRQADGTLQRAGGRGAVIDDAGAGYWIGARALRSVWRREDAAPGAGAATALGRELFAQLGGSDWATSRAFVIRASRGEVGLLGLAVARAAAAGDTEALALLERAGDELARLALALLGRVEVRAIATAGRAWTLHPAIAQRFEQAVRAVEPNVRIKRLTRSAQHAAAVLAAGGSPE
jgi:N-acetylglucosamine kinase-like BadF-type ATPase